MQTPASCGAVLHRARCAHLCSPRPSTTRDVPHPPHELRAAQANAFRLVHCTHFLVRVHHDCCTACLCCLLPQAGVYSNGAAILQHRGWCDQQCRD